MFGQSRRTILASIATGAAASLLPRAASATLFRGMPLSELVGRSQHALIGTALSARCLYLTLGQRRLLVTETLLRVEGVLGLDAPSENELSVRTLGGQLDGSGEIVDGQAVFVRDQRCVGFLERAPDGACWVTGMAQGHYPLDAAEPALVLRASPGLPQIVDWEASAVKRLVGTRLSEAEALVAKLSSR